MPPGYARRWLRPFYRVLLAACSEGEASSEPLRRIEALEARVERLERATEAQPQSARPRPLTQP